MFQNDQGAMTRGMTSNRWLVRWRSSPEARLRLFCFPYAGGGAMAYRPWGSGISAETEVCALQLPGRESRCREAPFQRLDALIDALADALAGELDKPYAFFGYSMGALLAFELARRFRREGWPGPLFLMASARVAPQRPLRRPPLHDLPEPEFRAELRRLEGMPAALFDHQELMEIVSPLLRADFAVSDHYDYVPEPPLSCPIIAVGGDQDGWVERDDLEAWREQTTADFRCHVLSGNHFFLKSSEPELLTIVRVAIADTERRR